MLIVRQAMILAAGRGERLRPLTDTTPKPLIKVGGECLIERHVRRLASAGINHIVINVSWLREQIIDTLGDGERFGVAIHYSDEGDTPLETAGGIRKALPLLFDEPMWVVNGDVYTDFDFTDVYTLGENDLGLVLLKQVPNQVHATGGDFLVRDGYAYTLGDAKEAGFTFCGISLVRPELYTHEDDRDERLSGRLLFKYAKQDRIRALAHEGLWCDVGTQARLDDLRAHVEQ